ncbi:MAG TPA: arsenic resistance N-acetyltransferase ArsN2 [Longimicrobiaceae bacterium]|nr:arsenic resistance N-acetyltransferase ArsN2 [Longimicrobiaceae bacterium]
MTIRIEPAGTADLPGVVALLDDARLPAAGIEQHFPAGFFVARGADGELVGAAGVEVYGGVGLLRSVVVAPPARGTGLGETLSRAVMELAAERGVRELYLLTTSADGYFPRLGFARVAREDLPGELDRSEQLRGACPSSAIAMRTLLEAEETGFLPRV